MRLAKSGYPGRGRPKRYVKQAWRLCLCWGSEGMSLTDYFLQLPNFPSLPHSSSKCYLPPKGHGPIYIISTHDQNFVARLLCPAANLHHVMQQHRDFHLLFCCLQRVKKRKEKTFIKLECHFVKKWTENLQQDLRSDQVICPKRMFTCTPYVMTLLFSSL